VLLIAKLAELTVLLMELIKKIKNCLVGFALLSMMVMANRALKANFCYLVWQFGSFVLQ